MSSATLSPERIPRPVWILLVGACSADENSLQDALDGEKCRIEIHAVAGGPEAIAVLRGQGGYRGLLTRPDLILLDHRLPRRDGGALLRQVRADPAFREIPVVMIASSRAEAEAAREESPGAIAYAVQPLGFRQLAQVVRSVPDMWISILTARPDFAPPEPPLLA